MRTVGAPQERNAPQAGRLNSGLSLPTIPLILLAAGGSTRMGTSKQLLPFGDSTLVRHAATTALATPCRPVLVVLGAVAEATMNAIADLPITTVINPDWSRGMGASLRLGLQTLRQAFEPPAVVVMVCDQPSVTPGLIGNLVDAFATGKTLVAAKYADTAGVPALIGSQWFDELAGLSDDAGARVLLRRHATKVTEVLFPEGILDVDTPADYQRLLAGLVPSDRPLIG